MDPALNRFGLAQTPQCSMPGCEREAVAWLTNEDGDTIFMCAEHPADHFRVGFI